MSSRFEPANALRYGPLRAFKSEEKANRAGMWAKAALFGDGRAVEWCRENGVLITRAQSEGINSAGGFLVPSEMEDAVVSLRERYGVFRRFARRVPMAGNIKTQPRRVGGAVVYFVAESDAITESQVTYDSISLSAKKIAALVKTSTELETDSAVDIAEDLAADFAEGFGQKEDDCGWNGDGSSTYGGMVGITRKIVDGSHDAGKVAAAAGHDTFAEVDATDLANLMSALPARALSGAAWYASQRGNALVFCRLAAASGGIAIVNDEPTFLGWPIRITQALPQVTSTLSGQLMVAFGDLRMAAAFGDRRGLTIARSDLGSTFETDQVMFRGTERFDINNHDLGDNTTAGAVVGLVGTS